MRDTGSGVTEEHRVGRWIRLVLVLAVGLGVVAPVVFAVTWVNFAGARFGWMFTMGAFGAVGFAIGWLAVSKHWRSVRIPTAVALAAVFGVGGIMTAHFAPPTQDRLREAVVDVAQPNWRLVSEYASGDAICFDTCTTVEREYQTDGDLATIAGEVGTAVAHLRCEQPGSPEAIQVEWRCRSGDDIRLRVAIGVGSRSGTVDVTAEAG